MEYRQTAIAVYNNIMAATICVMIQTQPITKLIAAISPISL